MNINLENIRTLTEFQRDAKTCIRELQRTGQPAILTVNGKPSVVVVDAAAYQNMRDTIEAAETIAAVQEALDGLDRGEPGEPADKFFGRMRKKYSKAAK